MIHTVLIVEDEKELREMLGEALELNGYSVVTAAEGDPGRSLDEAAVLAKFRRLTTPSLPLETADRLAASSLAA